MWGPISTFQVQVQTTATYKSTVNTSDEKESERNEGREKEVGREVNVNIHAL